MRFTAASLLLLVSAASANAQSPGVILGVGVAKCSDYQIPAGAGWNTNGVTRSLLTWSLGYLSGMSEILLLDKSRNLTLSDGDVEAVWAAIATGCRTAPSRSVHEVVENYAMQHLH